MYVERSSKDIKIVPLSQRSGDAGATGIPSTISDGVLTAAVARGIPATIAIIPISKATQPRNPILFILTTPSS